MAELPSGTVSLLFSDIEGSTALLSRLGATYAEALDGQRTVLREAWGDHGGTELGTEGDSFFVVFPTGEGAVTAAVQAQRQLAAFEWPGGEEVRVRMGIHTGTPQVHDGGYVGMDVHRAARIAGSAHGGQVVLSSATAELVKGCLPERVGLRDLGKHQLKDIAHPEHLFQLAIDGLRSDFPALKTLGAASGLPRPPTPLVGRDGELVKLSALLSSPEVRLVTLTGPGGSGKTRLAIALAQELVEQFPDGVFFVPLAAVTSGDVMWSSIAEVLDVPPDARTPPELLSHVRHRAALMVMDNLEQIETADNIVAELLAAAPSLVVIATTRRPLHVPAEHEHLVPPLELPDNATLADAKASGAVQLFVQQACRVRRSFELTSDNAGDVVAVCRHLDGLPLAIELAAARSKLLSPAALLTRLDKALDLAATGRQGPTRQQTLRDTLFWSYHLLDATQQAFFRRLGVFAGGADLDAISAVTNDISDGADPLNVIDQLADASLLTVSEQHDGEPRIGLLSTIRQFAVDLLRSSGEDQDVHHRHAQFYLALAESRGLQFLRPGQQLSTRAQLEIEQDNFREALAWTFSSTTVPPAAARVGMGLRLATSLCLFWTVYGYPAEARQWLERGIEAAAEQPPSPEVAKALAWLPQFMNWSTETIRMEELWFRSLAMAHHLGDHLRAADALSGLGKLHQEAGHLDAARQSFHEAVALVEPPPHSWQDALQKCWVIEAYANFELRFGSPDYARQLSQQVRDLAVSHGIETQALRTELDIAWALALAERGIEAVAHLHHHTPAVLNDGSPLVIAELVIAYSAVLAVVGHAEQAASLQGTYEAAFEQPVLAAFADEPSSGPALIERCYANARTLIHPEAWEEARRQGRNRTPEQALADAREAAENILSAAG